MARCLAVRVERALTSAAVWAIVRQFGRMDEFVRLRSLENFAIAAAVTACVSFTYGFLEGAGFPKLAEPDETPFFASASDALNRWW